MCKGLNLGLFCMAVKNICSWLNRFCVTKNVYLFGFHETKLCFRKTGSSKAGYMYFTMSPILA